MKYPLILLVMLITACSCNSPSEPPPTTRTAEPADAIDQNLMIALSKAKNFHHKAKVYMSDGNIADAIASVREILSLQFPPGAPEGEDVRNDARALLAKLLLGQGKPESIDEAMRVVQEGIAQSQRKSFFVANLYTVEGEIHEARAVTLPAEQAKDEKHKAIEAYDTSNQIDTELQKQLMESK